MSERRLWSFSRSRLSRVGGHAGDFRSGVSGGSHSRQKKHTTAKILEVKDQMSLKDDTEEIRLCNIAKITDATIAGGHGTTAKQADITSALAQN